MRVCSIAALDHLNPVDGSLRKSNAQPMEDVHIELQTINQGDLARIIEHC